MLDLKVVLKFHVDAFEEGPPVRFDPSNKRLQSKFLRLMESALFFLLLDNRSYKVS